MIATAAVGAARIVPGYRELGRPRRTDLYDVYDAWSEERECRCVVKVLRPERRASLRDRQRVRDEGGLLSSLTHPHIVRAYELHERPFPFLVLEAATGATLSRQVEDAGLGLHEVAQLVVQLSSALTYLHRRGYLHLDLRPSNIASDRGHFRLLDLSMARRPGIVPEGFRPARSSSPEQASGEVVTEATDIWGLGCVLYEALTAVAPFGPSGPRLGSVPVPLKSIGRLRPAMTSVVMRCFAPAPAARPQLSEIVAVFSRFA